MSVAGLLVIASLCAWLTHRMLYVRTPILKWSGRTLGGFLGGLCLLAAFVALLGVYRLSENYSNFASDVVVTNAEFDVERGERLAYLCVDCHSSSGNLPLDGESSAKINESIGTIVAPNLTPGGPLAE